MTKNPRCVYPTSAGVLFKHDYYMEKLENLINEPFRLCIMIGQKEVLVAVAVCILSKNVAEYEFCILSYPLI